MTTSTDPIQSTLARVRTWSRSLLRLESILDRLEALEDCPLARGLGWLLGRCLDERQGANPAADAPGPRGMDALLDGRGAATREEQQRRLALEILMDLAGTYLDDGDPGRFTTDPEQAQGLTSEFLSLRHLDRCEDLPLLSPAMNRCWTAHREAALKGGGTDCLRQELTLLQLARSLYALAIGIPTFPEHMALAHRVGESQLNPSFQARPSDQLAAAD